MTNQIKKPGQPAKGSGPVFEWRNQAGLTQEQAAKRLNCAIRTIKRCEAQGRAPAPYSVAGVAFEKERRRARRSRVLPKPVNTTLIMIITGQFHAQS